jgi:HEAT repeat protein
MRSLTYGHFFADQGPYANRKMQFGHTWPRGALGGAKALTLLALLFTGSCGANESVPPVPTDVSPKIRSLIEQTLSDNPKECAAAARELSNLGQEARPALPFLMRLLNMPPADNPDAQYFSYRALKQIGGPAFDMLLERVNSRSLGRAYMVRLLGDSGDGRAAETLIESLNDRDGEVRRSAALALCHIPDSRALQPLLKRLWSDSDPQVRAKAALALCSLGDVRAVKSLAAALRGDKARDVREAAATALGRLGDLGAVKALLGALETDADTGVRSQAAVALGRLGDRRAIVPILKFIESCGSDYDRTEAIAELGGLCDTNVIDFLTQTMLRPPRLHGAPDIENLVAADALGELKDGRAADVLARVWQDTSQPGLLRARAALALGRTHDYRAIDALTYVMHELVGHYGPGKLEALELLGRMKDPRAVALAKSALCDPDEMVKIAAAVAVKRAALARKQEEEENLD